MGPHLDMQAAVQEDVAWLEVQMEQRWLNAVEEVHGQAGLMDGADLELPAEALSEKHLLQEPLAMNSITTPRGCLQTDVLEILDLSIWPSFFSEAIHIRAMEKGSERWKLVTLYKRN